MRLGLPPRWAGHRYFKSRDPRDFESTQVHGRQDHVAALPLNVKSREELSRERRAWGFSFHDVPLRPVAETSVSRVPDCRVLVGLDHRDQWRIPSYAIFHGQDVLNVRGTGPDPRLHGPLFGKPAAARIDEGIWILEQWDQNYSHWVQWHLVKLALIRKLELEVPVLVPAGSPLAPVVAASLAMMGIRHAIELPGSVFDVGQLTVIGMDHYRDALLHDLRTRLPCTPAPAEGRRIFISRQLASRRRLANEDEVWRILEPLGYSRVFLERLTFEQQMQLMSGAVAMFSLHGSGQANMLFAPAGMQVAEISDITFPNPQFYALASAVGHDFWLLHGRPEGREFEPGQHDVVADIQEVRHVADAIEDRLEQRRRETVP